MISYKNTYRFKLTQVLKITDEYFSVALLKLGITPKHYGTLLRIKEYPGMTQKEIAALLNIDQSTMGNIIDILEEKRFLKRIKHQTDRRAYCLKLTVQGETVIAKLWKLMRESERKTISNLTEKESEMFEVLLNKIIEK